MWGRTYGRKRSDQSTAKHLARRGPSTYGPGTTSAPASLTGGGSPPPATNPLPNEIRPSQAGRFRAPCVTQKGRILNHTRNKLYLSRIALCCHGLIDKSSLQAIALLRGENQSRKVVQGVTFRNGVEIINAPARNAA